MKEIEIFEDIATAVSALAEAICQAAARAIERTGRFHLVLSGGNSPLRLYKLLASDTYRHRIDWAHTYFFFGDERYVPAEDARRNALMVHKALLLPLKIPKQHIFEVNTLLSPEEAARQYVHSISKHFEQGPMVFDWVLLGLGANAHTASLFPHTAVLAAQEATVLSVYVPELDSYRITMTAPLLNQAKEIAFLVFGQEKAEAVYQVLESRGGSATEYPARLIDAQSGRTTWYLDVAAASLLH